MINKKNVPLIVGLAIPVLMIIFVALSIYLPSLFNKPQYDFIYTNIGTYNGRTTYQVDKTNHVIEVPVPITDLVPKPTIYDPQPELYYYSETSNTSRKLTLDEAKKFNLDTNLTSVDGYEVTQGQGSGDFFFGGGYDYNSIYVKGHGINKKVSTPNNYGYYNFRFLGWVQK
jgi:hypothetical protein